MVRKNQHGEAMEGRATQAVQNVMRRIRRRASREGVTLKPFRQIYGYETENGPEWIAEAIRHPCLFVAVWSPCGHHQTVEAHRTCDEVYVVPLGDHQQQVVAVSWRGPWEDALDGENIRKGDEQKECCDCGRLTEWVCPNGRCESCCADFCADD